MASARRELELTNENTHAAMARMKPCILLIERRFIIFSFQTPVRLTLSTDSVSTVAGIRAMLLAIKMPPTASRPTRVLQHCTITIRVFEEFHDSAQIVRGARHPQMA